MKIVTTKDGSSSIYIPEMDEHYHSHHGAIQEAKHVFVKNGFERIAKTKIRILEVGFGTGLNALLTLINKGEKEIHYYGIEAYPLDNEIHEKLNYIKQLEVNNYDSFFRQIHYSKWNKKFELCEGFYLDKLHTTLQEVKFKKPFDLIYYDAFGPRAQSEMWDKELFKKLFDYMNLGAVFVTYCAMGQLKRDLKCIGFKVETLQGPPGKREMVRAIKV